MGKWYVANEHGSLDVGKIGRKLKKLLIQISVISI